MNIKNKVLTIMILVLSLIITMFSCVKPNDAKEPEKEIIYTEEQTAFLKQLEVIKQIEDETKIYVKENNLEDRAELLTLNYIRNIRYNTRTWDIAAGTVNQDYVEYINQKLPEMQNYLKGIDTLTETFTNEEYDFIHLCATLNATLFTTNTKIHDLTGWAGDIVQFVAAIKSGNEKLEDFATEKGGLNKPDLIADIDAVNMYKLYLKSEDKSIYNVMCKYYESLLNEDRNEMFVKNIGLSTKNEEDKVGYIYNRMKMNSFLVVLNDTYNISFVADEQLFKEVISKFVDYFN